MNDPYAEFLTVAQPVQQEADPYAGIAEAQPPPATDPYAEFIEQPPAPAVATAPYTELTERAAKGTFLGDVKLAAKSLATGVYSAAFDVFPKILAEAIRGGDIDVNDADTTLDRWIKEQKKDLERWDMPEHEKNRKLFGILKAQDLQASIQNLGYSAAIGVAGMLPGVAIGSKVGGAIGLALGSPTGPGAAVTGGIGATIGGTIGGMIGAAATTAPVSYRATKDQFLSDMLDRALQQNPNLTQEQWTEMRATLEPDAQAYAFWEAAPETVGNMITAGLIKTPVGTYLKHIPNIKNAVARVLAKAGTKIALDLPIEVSTETLTGYKQAGIEAKVGLRETAPTVSESFWEVLPQTLVTTVAGMGMGSAADRISSVRQESQFYKKLKEAGYDQETVKKLAGSMGFDGSALQLALNNKMLVEKAIASDTPPSVMSDIKDSLTPSVVLRTYVDGSENGANRDAGVRAVDELVKSDSYRVLQQQMRETLIARREKAKEPVTKPVTEVLPPSTPPVETPKGDRLRPTGEAADRTEALVSEAAKAVEPAKPRLFEYQLQNRPVVLGSVPDGRIGTRDDGSRFGVVQYDRPLTQEEQQRFELKPLDPQDPANIKAAHQAESAKIDFESEYGDKPFSITTPTGTMFYSPDIRRGGDAWRVTFLDKDGKPTGHIEFNEYREARDDAASEKMRQASAPVEQARPPAAKPAAPAPKVEKAPSVGDVRTDDTGHRQVFRMIDPHSVGLTEPDTPNIKADVDSYAERARSGEVPPPVDIVFNEPTGKVVSSNRRRILAARKAGTLVPAWVDVEADSRGSQEGDRYVFKGEAAPKPVDAPAPAEPTTTIPSLQAAPNQPVARYQLPRTSPKEKRGKQIAIHQIDDNIFSKMIRPIMARTAQTLDTFRREFPNATHVELTKAPNENWTLTAIGSLPELQRIPQQSPNIYKPTSDFDETETMLFAAKTRSAKLPQEQYVRFEGTQSELLQKIEGKSPETTPAAFTDNEATYLVFPEKDRAEGVTVGRFKIYDNVGKVAFERLFAWDTDRWHRIPIVVDRKLNPNEIKVAAKKFVAGAFDGVPHPNAESKQRQKPAEVETTGLTVKESTEANGLPVTIADPAKKIPNTNITSADKQKIWWKSLTKWITSLPKFVGHKREMAGPVTKAAITPEMGGWTTDQANRIDTIYEPFGGGGSWGLFQATTNFRNVKKIVLGELNQDRLDMIAYMHQNGDKLIEDLRRKDPSTNRSAYDIIELLWEDGLGVKSGRGLQHRLKEVLEKKTYDKQPITQAQMPLLQIVHDLVVRRTIPLSQAIEIIANQTYPLHKMAQEFVKTGGTIEYRKQNAYDPANMPPSGDNVLAILDPPYVFTEGYGEKGEIVGVDTYAQTLNLIDRIVDNGNNIIYTDSAWWKADKKKYPTGTTAADKKIFDAEFKEEQDLKRRVPKEEKDKALAILDGIQDKLKRFQVTEQRIGGHRYEVMGIHNAIPDAVVETAAPVAAAPTETFEESQARRKKILDELPYKVGQKVLFQKKKKFHKAYIEDIWVEPDGSISVTVAEKDNMRRTIDGDKIKLTGAQASALVRKKQVAERAEMPKDEQKAMLQDAKNFDEVVRMAVPDYYDPQQEMEDGASKAIATAWEQSIAPDIDPDDQNLSYADLQSKIVKAQLLPKLLAWVQAKQDADADALPYMPPELPKPTWQPSAPSEPEIRMSLAQQEFLLPPAPTTTQAGATTPITQPATEVGATPSVNVAQLIEDNIPRATEMALRYNVPNTTDEEKISVAQAALVKAANMFKPERSADFVAYAKTTIRNALNDLFNEQMGEKEFTISRLDAPVGSVTDEEATSTLSNFLPDWRTMPPDQQAAQLDVLKIVQETIAGMTPADRQIIDGITSDTSFRDIAVQLGITPAAVSQRKDKILAKLRAAIEQRNFDQDMVNEIFETRAPEITMATANRQATGAGVTVAQAQSRINNWVSKQANLPNIRVIQTIEEADALGLSEATMSTIRNEQPRGFFHSKDNQIVIVADKLKTAEEALEVVLHEAIGHYGVERVLGKDFNKVMSNLSREISDADLNRLASDYYNALPEPGLDNPLDSEANRAYLAAEYVANNAQTEPTLWQKFVELVRKALSKIMPATYVNRLFKQGKIDEILRASREYVRGDKPLVEQFLKANEAIRIRMSKPLRANPITVDDETRNRYRRYEQTDNPSRISYAEMEARVKPLVEKEIEKKGVENVFIDYNISGFVSSAEGTVKAQTILNRKEFGDLLRGDNAIKQDMAVGLMTNFLTQGTDEARAMAYRRDKLETPAERQAVINKLLATQPDDIIKRWSNMTKEQRDTAILEQRERIKRVKQTMKLLGIDDIAAVSEELLMNGQQFAEVINNIATEYATTGDKWYEYWRNAILSGLHTNIVNVTSNATFSFWELFAQRPVEALLNTIVRDPNAPTFKSLIAAYRQMWPNIHNANRAFLTSFQTETGMFTAIDTKGKIAIAGKKGKVIRTPQRLLLAIDEWFKTILTDSLAFDYATRIADKNKLVGQDRENFIQWAATTNDGTSSAYDTALEEATHILFQDKPGAIGSALLSARNAKGLTGWAFKYIFPFVTTPTNLIKIGIKKSPFGLLNVGLEGIAALRGKESRYAGTQGKAKLITDVVEQGIAWSVAAMLYSFTAPPDDDDRSWPKITGTITGTPQEKRFKMLNIPAQSIRIRNRWYSYARLEPFSNALTLIVDALTTLHNVRAGKGLSGDDARKLLSLVKDKTYLQSLSDIMRGIDDPDEWVALSQNFASSWMPNLLKQAVRASDPLQRDNRVREKGLAFLGKSFFVRGAQRALPVPAFQPLPRIDHWGREISSDVGRNMLGQPASDILWRMTVPIRVQNERDETNIDRMIWNWNRKAEEGKQWWPGNIKPKIKFAGRDIELNDQQYEAYQRLRGQIAMQTAKRITWNFNDPSERDIRVLQKVFERAGKAARSKIIMDALQNMRKQRAETM